MGGSGARVDAHPEIAAVIREHMRRTTCCLSGLFVLYAIGTLAQTNAGFNVSDNWAQLPPDTPQWGPLASVTVDNKDSVIVIRRTFPSVFVFGTNGQFRSAWGREGLFSGRGAHGIRVDADGNLWATDTEYNVVYKLTMSGQILLEVGRKNVAGDNRSQDAFNRPADVAVAHNGDFFVADGYGNSRVVKFSKDGKFRKIIGGTKGTGPGQFDLVHAVVIDSKGRLLVGDRNNARIQVFDLEGKFLDQWSGLGKPYGLHITRDDTLYVGDADGGTITIAKNGKPVDVIRDLGRPHWVGMDTKGALYMADVRGFVKKIVRVKQTN